MLHRHRPFVTVLSAVVAAASLVLAASASRSLAEPKENAAAAQDKGDWTLSAPRVHTMPRANYFHTTFTTTFAEMDRVGPELEELFKALREADVELATEEGGYVLFIYKGVSQDRSKPFELSIGMTVPAGTKAVGKYQVNELPEFKCASALYNGGLASIGAVYGKHYGELVAAGHTPTDEAREMYLYWEGFESDNNVMWLQAGIQ